MFIMQYKFTDATSFIHLMIQIFMKFRFLQSLKQKIIITLFRIEKIDLGFIQFNEIMKIIFVSQQL